MCHTWKRREHDELTAAQWGQLFDALPRLCWLDLTGGEPLLRRDFGEVVAHALERLPALGVLHFQTNGWATQRAVDVVRQARAQRSGVDLIVTVSIDGPPAVHDLIRGRPGSYDRAVATLRALCAVATDDPGLQIHAGTTVTAANRDTFESVGAGLAQTVPGFVRSQWHWNVGQRSEHFFGNADSDGVEAPDVGDALRRHVRKRGVPRDMVALMEAIYLVNLRAVVDGEASGIPCQALRSSMFVSPEGDLYPCHVWDRPLGNVRRTPFADLWDSHRVADARAQVRRLACGGCFSACEAYPALAGAPIRTALHTVRRVIGGGR